MTSNIILAFVRDLIFQVRIEAACQQTGCSVQLIDRVDLIPEYIRGDSNNQIAKPLIGRNGGLIELLSIVSPVLLIFDLENKLVPWKNWMEILTTDPATRRIPIIAFGSHLNQRAFADARKAGAHKVFSRSRFFRDLPSLIKKYAREISHAHLTDWCEAPLPLAAFKGLEEFNRGEYFAAHESLESAWLEEKHPGREMYRAILQIAVAYHHIVNGNFFGAAKMFLRMRQWITPLPDCCRGIDIKKLKKDSEVVYSELRRLGPERMQQFDLNLLQPVRYQLVYENSSMNKG